VALNPCTGKHGCGVNRTLTGLQANHRARVFQGHSCGTRS